jgi:hypothetical protein
LFKDGVLDHLLGNGRSTLSSKEVSCEEVCNSSTYDRQRVDAPVAIELIVLYRDGSILDVVRDVLEWNDGTFDILVEVIQKNLTRAVIYLGRLLYPALLKRREVWYLEGGYPNEQSSERYKAEYEKDDRPVNEYVFDVVV